MYRILFVLLACLILMGVHNDGRHVRIHVSGETTPSCDSGRRGELFNHEPGVGTRDSLKICMKSDADAYAWVEIANGGA